MFLEKKLFKIFSSISFFLLIFICGVIQTNFALADTDTPLPIYQHEMVYDTQNNQIIMFGGEIRDGTPTDLDTTWLFKSQNQTWIKPSGTNSPGSRFIHRMVYNSLTGKVFLFGGITYSAGVQVNDTWEFDPVTNQWTELHPINAPSVRAAHGMYYDPDYNEVIFFAGTESGHSVVDDMWAYNFTANNWYELHPSGGPGTGYGFSFVYDEINKVGVLFGGRFNGVLRNDIWLFNRTTLCWIKKYPSTKPMERYHTGLVYNPNDNTFIMFGGDNELVASRSMDDTWVYNSHSNVWTEFETSTSPPACCKHEMVFDQYLDRAILFGGIGQSFTVPYNELWYYDPIAMTWSQNATTTEVPTYLSITLLSFVSVVIITRLSKSKLLKQERKH
ncbi:MAG: Kelch repeat-containing protein [Candidatus Heimdallarchaeota archaeon]